ncbi:hypothetical protein DMC25_15010 [Caulobacter sp. D4A]|nr:hypothetical protein DMC25_15010 [Caulobacter sp. D4A]PXA95214.1 hypothetical protein DMC18_04375 [Caulobacter sp. D5]
MMKRRDVLALAAGLSGLAVTRAAASSRPIPFTIVYFKPGGYEIDQRSVEDIPKLAARMLDPAEGSFGGRVSVKGHADGVELEAGLKRLALNRAQVVVETLVAAGVPRRRFFIEAAAEPMYPNDKADQRNCMAMVAW